MKTKLLSILLMLPMFLMSACVDNDEPTQPTLEVDKQTATIPATGGQAMFTLKNYPSWSLLQVRYVDDSNYTSTDDIKYVMPGENATSQKVNFEWINIEIPEAAKNTVVFTFPANETGKPREVGVTMLASNNTFIDLGVKQPAE